MVTVNRATWILNILGIGLGGVLIGIATMMDRRQTVSDCGPAGRWGYIDALAMDSCS